MTAFTPSSIHVVAALVTALAAVLLLGLAITRMRSRPAARAAAWALAGAAAIFAERTTASEPPGVRMIAIIGLLLYAMKAVVGVESEVRLSPVRWLAFAALWPGMRPAPFAALPSPACTGVARIAARGLACTALGLGLILLGRATWSATASKLCAAALVLPGLSLILHFGLFNLLTAAWRVAGVAVEPLFRAPLASTSLREFWGRRWNLAFAEMSAAGVYRPVSAMAGRRCGIAAAFLASGILHELAISLPVGAGYGLPLAYFALHGAAMLFEGTLEARGAPVNALCWVGRTWTIAWLVAPLPILFHAPFLRGVVWPLVGMCP